MRRILGYFSERFGATPDGISGGILILLGVSMLMRSPVGSLSILPVWLYVAYAFTLLFVGIFLLAGANVVNMVQTLIGAIALLPFLLLTLIGVFVAPRNAGVPSLQVAIYAGVIIIPIFYQLQQGAYTSRRRWLNTLVKFTNMERVTGLIILAYAALLWQRPVGSVETFITVFNTSADVYGVSVAMAGLFLLLVPRHFLTLILGNAPVIFHTFMTVFALLNAETAPLTPIVLFIAYFLLCVYVAFDREEWLLSWEHSSG